MVWAMALLVNGKRTPTQRLGFSVTTNLGKE
jgi:hypothetical protein